jgi:hypothetical protein
MLAGAVKAATHLVRRLEDYWFDSTRSVSTSQLSELDGLHLAGERRDAFMHVPARARNARAALRALPVQRLEDYTFIDLGSGVGRSLFVAAEYPFRSIVGVELAAELHQTAESNIRRFRSSRQRCPEIRSINASASDYIFPDGNLVVYIFNPFGPAVLGDVLKNLESSIASHPRDVIVLMLYPEFGHIVDGSPELALYSGTSKYRIYRSVRGR